MTAPLAPPTPTHPHGGAGLRLLRGLRQAAGDLAGAEVTGTAAQTAVLVNEITAMLTAYQARVVRERAVQEAEASGAGTPAHYLARHTRQDTREVHRHTQLAQALQTATATEAALGKGAISDRHAHVITGALHDLPQRVTPAQRQIVEDALIEAATRLDPTRLRREARRALAAVEPDPAVVDDHEDALLTAEEDAAIHKTWLTLHDLDDGTTHGHFVVPTLQAHMLRKVIHAMAAPRRHNQPAAAGRGGKQAAQAGQDAAGSPGDTNGAPSVDYDHIPHTPARDNATGSPRDGTDTSTAGGSSTGTATVGQSGNRPASDTPTDVWAGLTWKQRYGRAFAELLTHIPGDHLHDKSAATLVVHLDHQHLQHQVAKAVDTDTAHRMSATTLRRTACQAGILPAIDNGASVPIDLGRTKRLFTSHQRLLLAQHYPTCAADGCDRPFAWTETHHIDPWTPARDRPGGPTDLANALPLCSHHHHLIHHRDYTHHLSRRTAGQDSAFTTTASSGNRTTARTVKATALPTYIVTYRRRQ